MAKVIINNNKDNYKCDEWQAKFSPHKATAYLVSLVKMSTRIFHKFALSEKLALSQRKFVKYTD